MSDPLIEALRTTADKMRAVVVTQTHQLDGELYLPRTTKERRLTALLSSDRKFLAMTNVTITHLMSGAQQPEPTPFLQVHVGAIQYITPRDADGQELD